MNTQKAVYNRLFVEANKTKLESQKIELGLVDDIKSIKKAFMQNMQKSNKSFDKVRSAAMDINQIVTKIEKNTTQAESLVKKIRGTAKDLGINVKQIEDFDLLENIAEGTAAKVLKTKFNNIIKSL